MPNWAIQLLILMVIIVGVIIVINALGDAGAFR